METTALHPSPDPPEKNPAGDQTGTVAPSGSPSRQILLLPDGSIPVPLGSGTITSVLGEGGAAIVYEIWVEKLGIARAVKVLKPNASIETTGRFETEMRITAQLRHPNIIEIHNVGEWHGVPYIEMEKIDGSSLDAMILEHGSLPLKICTSIGILVCRALNFMHNYAYLINEKKHVGILHRDLKPGNIMLSKNGIIKLMDFGIATPTGVSMHTMDGSVVGSMQYIAPELLEGAKHASARSDIFSFGCVFYEMITGQRTFEEKNMAKLVAARMKNSYRPLPEFKVKCPRQLVKLINACLTLKPDKRIASVAEILVRLEKIHARLSKNKPEDLVEYYISSPLEKSTVAFKRKPPFKMITVACCAAAAAAGVCAYLFLTRPAAVQITTTARWDLTGAAPRVAAAPQVSAAVNPAPASPSLNEFGVPLPTVKAPGANKGHVPAGEIKSGQVANILSPGSREKPLISSLQNTYGTKDLLTILAEETGKGNFGTALKVFEALDRESAATVSARLYELRALQGLGNKEALDAFFLRPDVPDKEYFLAKAQHLASFKRYAEAADLCDKSRQAQASIGDAEALDLTSSYVKASCLTNNFMVLGTEEARKLALESWFEVKYLFRSNQDHPYFELANKNIRLLSNQSKKTGL
jgi:serine/threonine-protein kinase